MNHSNQNIIEIFCDGSAGKTSSGFGVFSPHLGLEISIPVEEVLTSFQIETIALEYVLSYIQKEKLTFVKINMDCQSLVDSFFKKEKYKEVAINHNISVHWIPRSANRIADKLAGEARTSVMKTLNKDNMIKSPFQKILNMVLSN